MSKFSRSIALLFSVYFIFSHSVNAEENTTAIAQGNKAKITETQKSADELTEKNTVLNIDNIGDIETLLKTADSVKSTDASLFNRILEKLEADSALMDQDQLQLFLYLQAYQKTYRAQFSQAKNILGDVLATNANNTVALRAQSLFINIHAATQDWQAGSQMVSKVLSIDLSAIEEQTAIDSLSTIVVFYNEIGQYELALKYLEQIKRYDIEKRSTCIVYQQTVRAKLNLNTLNKNDTSIDIGKTFCRSANEPIMLNLIRVYEAQLYSESGDAHKTLRLLLNNLEDILNTNFPPLIATTYNLLAQATLQQNRLAKSKEYALLAEELTAKLNKTKQPVKTYKILSQIFTEEENYKKALDYYVKFAEADSGYIDEVKAKTIAFQMAAHREFERAARIKVLNAQNRELAAAKALATQKQQDYYRLVGLLLVLLVGISLWSYRSWILKEKMRKLTQFDTLTGIYNRGHFVHRATKLLQKQQAKNEVVSCIVFDLDFLKQVNDDYGHAAGDFVLQSIVNTGQTLLQKHDIFGRIGGDEFCILLPGSSITYAEYIATECQRAFATIDYSAFDLKQPISASFGITDVFLSGYHIDELLADADGAMYSSKISGRNQLTVFRKSKS